MPRRIPRWSDLAPLLRRAPAQGTRIERRVRRAPDIDGLRTLARRRTPRSVFGYVDGGAEEEVSMRRSRAAFERIEFVPAVLRDVSTVSTETTILGQTSAQPFVLAPTGFTRMMHAAGEPAVAGAASAAGVIYALSTVGTTSPEDVAAASGAGRRWFQLYVWRDRERSRALIDRARLAGFDTLVLTVDVPVPGARLRDSRSGLTIPPTLTARTFLDGAMHPRWLIDFLTTEPLEFASMPSGPSMSLEQIAGSMFDPTVQWDDLHWFRDAWPGRLVVKGVQNLDDAVRLPEYGIDGVVLSNHGGRQLDRAVTPLEILPEVVDAVGDDIEVMVDTGVRSGADVVAAIALGARAVLVGRAYLYGLMAGGEAGVARSIELLAADVRRTMQLLGVTEIDQLGPRHVRMRP